MSVATWNEQRCHSFATGTSKSFGIGLNCVSAQQDSEHLSSDRASSSLHASPKASGKEIIETLPSNGSTSSLRSSGMDAADPTQPPSLLTDIATAQPTSVRLLESCLSNANADSVRDPDNDDKVSLGFTNDDVSMDEDPSVQVAAPEKLFDDDGSTSPLRSSVMDAVDSYTTKPPSLSTDNATAQPTSVRLLESCLSNANTHSVRNPDNDDMVSLGSTNDGVSMDDGPSVQVATPEKLPDDSGSTSPLRSSVIDGVDSHPTQPPSLLTDIATAQPTSVRLLESYLSNANSDSVRNPDNDDMVSLGSTSDDVSIGDDPSAQVAALETLPDGVHGIIGFSITALGSVVYTEVFDSHLWDASFLRRAIFHFAESGGSINVVSEGMLRYWAYTDSNITTAQLLSRAIAACLPFRILVPRSSIPAASSLPVRENINKLPLEKDITKFIALWKDFLKNDLLLRPEARGFLFIGGFVTRLALYFGGADLMRRAQMGPSAEAASMYGFRFKALNGDTFYDDFVAPAAIDALLGSPAHNFNTKKTLFPDDEALARHFPQYQGVWTQKCEDLFQAILRSFQKKPERRNVREWGRWLRVGDHNKRDEPTIDIKGPCADVLRSLDLHPPHDRQWHLAPLTSIRPDLHEIVHDAEVYPSAPQSAR